MSKKIPARKRGLSELVTILLMIVVAAGALAIVGIIVYSSIDNAEQQVYRADPGVKIFVSPEHCTGGVIATVFQNGIRGNTPDKKITRVTQAYQISNDLDEKKWNADFTGDGRADKIIRRLTRDQITAISTANANQMHEQNAGVIVWNSSYTNNPLPAFMANAQAAMSGDYDSIVLLLTDVEDTSSQYFTISWGGTRTPANTIEPTEPNIRIQKLPGSPNKKYEYFGFRYAVKVNHRLNCWTIDRISDNPALVTTTTQGTT